MDKLIRTVLFIFRLAFGAVFICSGVLKMIDPVGTGLIFTEYLKAFRMDFLIPASAGLGMALSVTEFVLGIGVLVRIRMRVISWAALVLMCFFTVLTFILYRFSPIEDCGCFGEAIHLTNAQTFAKNLILLCLIVPVFLFRRKFRQTADAAAEWTYLGLHALSAVILSLYAYRTLPLKEFGDFREGADISIALSEGNIILSEDTYVYEKDGIRREFALSAIPDTTWTFVEVRQCAEAAPRGHAFDFAVSGMDGAYITDELISNGVPVVLFVVYDPDDAGMDELSDMAETASMLEMSGVTAKILLPGSGSLEALAGRCDSTLTGEITASAAFCDYKTLISLCRSNCGAVCMKEGLIVDKYPRSRVTYPRIMASVESDSDEYVVRDSIRQKLLLELIILITFLNIVLFRYICGLIMKTGPSVGKVQSAIVASASQVKEKITAIKERGRR